MNHTSYMMLRTVSREDILDIIVVVFLLGLAVA